MKRTLNPVLAALVAAGIAGAAVAQQQSPQQQAPQQQSAQQPAPLPQPSTTPSSALGAESKPVFVDQPVASIATGAAGPNIQHAQTVADALNAEPLMKGSKLTVVPDEKGLFLTGVTGTAQQMAKAVTIATHHGGGGPVASNISTEQVILDAGATAPDPALAMSAQEVQLADAAQQQPEQQAQAAAQARQ